MSSDAIFSYITKLLALLSIAALFSIGYSAYKLIPSLYEQQPVVELSGTHVIIRNILIRNQGLYPMELALEVEADGRVYSSSVKLNPGEEGELKLAVPAHVLSSENLRAYLKFAILPFVKAEVELPKGIYKGAQAPQAIRAA